MTARRDRSLPGLPCMEWRKALAVGSATTAARWTRCDVMVQGRRTLP